MEASPGAIGKLKSIAAKRRRKKAGSIAETTASNTSNDDNAPERGLVSQTTSSDLAAEPAQEDGRARRLSRQLSTDVMGEEDSSLISIDSESLDLSSRPTAISTHPSQIGYLTTSSPIIQAAHHPDSLPAESQVSQAFPQDSFQIEAAPDSSNSKPASVSSQSHALSDLAPAANISQSGSIGRFRGVFRAKRSSAGSVSPSPERRSQATEPDRVPSKSFTAPPDAATVISGSSERLRHLSKGHKIDTSNPPRTPPRDSEHNTPVIVNTPPTPTDHHRSDSTARSVDSAGDSVHVPVQTSVLAQRRSRADSGSLIPSKLSNFISAPLTPNSDGGSTTPGNTSSNFFASMFTAVQNTANTLSNTITNTNIPGGQKQKTANVKELGDIAEDTSVEVESSTEAQHSQSTSQEPAVRTLGMGDLSLSQLGIMEPGSGAPTPVTAKFADHETRARSESAPVEATADNMSEDSHTGTGTGHKHTLSYDYSNGLSTPPQGSVYEGKSGIQRTSSIRSAIGRRRNRGSSAATGGTATTGMTIGAAIAAANASLAHPHASLSTPKLTGFAVANKKRNRDFHTLFKSVPDDDYLIEDYSCAIQREILAHGRLYISEGHLCFSSNIFGWVTTLVMSFDEIVSVEKRSTALVFKNGLEISTLHAKHVFASFASRDTTYDLIVKIWKLGHPHLKSSVNGVHIDETGGDRTEKAETESISLAGSGSVSASDDESEDGNDVYDEDEDGDENDAAETTQSTDASPADAQGEKAVSRKPSGAVALNGAGEKADGNAAPNSQGDLMGPATHAPTDCGDSGSHYDKVIGDDVIPAPLGKVYNLLFGPASVDFMGKWLTGDQKCTELQMEDKKGLTEDNKTRTYSYIKPLYAPIGPKQTKCIVTEEIMAFDLEKAVNIQCTTQTPDVPSGNVFSVKTKYCLSWAENNSTRLQANCTIEWTGKSWLKGPIEKGANDGQMQYFKELAASIKSAVSSRTRTAAAPAAGAKGLKKRKKGKASQSAHSASDHKGLSKATPKDTWGILEPLHPFLGPVLDILKSLITGNVVYGLLVGLLVAAWFGFGTMRQTPRPYGSEMGYLAYPHRVAAYEEMWRREESELWEWLEERLGTDRHDGGFTTQAPPRKRGADHKSVEEKLRDERMDEREIRDAIRVTEERLEVLRGVMDKNSVQKEAGNAPGTKQ